jgi:hypothetical protein
MSWSSVHFGKYKSKSLPQIIFSDPDWFFWAYEDNRFESKGILYNEAQDIYNKSRNIKIPENNGVKMIAEYVIHPDTMKFAQLDLVPPDRPEHIGSSPNHRIDTIDLSFPWQMAKYDKLGNKLMLSYVKYYLFGSENYKMTKKRCEAFFDDNDNFTI